MWTIYLRRPNSSQLVLGEYLAPVLIDHDGSLNQYVWTMLGHLRGNAVFEDAGTDHQLVQSVAKWPIPRPIPLNQPANLQLNELWWPLTQQHHAELWVAVPNSIPGMSVTTDERLAQSVAGQTAPWVHVGASSSDRSYVTSLVPGVMNVLGAWVLPADRLRDGLGVDQDSALLAKGMLVMRLGDSERTTRRRVKGYLPRGGVGIKQQGHTAWQYDDSASSYMPAFLFASPNVPASQWVATSKVAPCPLVPAMFGGRMEVWADSAMIGCGAFPVKLPGMYAIRDPYANSNKGWISWFSYRDIGKVKEYDSQYLARTRSRPTPLEASKFGDRQVALASIPPSDMLFSREPLLRANALCHLRADRLLCSNAIKYHSSVTDAATRGGYPSDLETGFVTSFFINYDHDGVLTNVRLNGDFDDWLDAINKMYAAAVRRPPRRVMVHFGSSRSYYNNSSEFMYYQDYYRSMISQYGFEDPGPNAKSFPPIAVIFRPAGCGVGSSPAIDGPPVFEVEEIPWTVNQLPSHLPVTWTPEAAGVSGRTIRSDAELYAAWRNASVHPGSPVPDDPIDLGSRIGLDVGIPGDVMALAYDPDVGYWKTLAGDRCDFGSRWWMFAPIWLNDGGADPNGIPPGGWASGLGWAAQLPCPGGSWEDYCDKEILWRAYSAKVIRSVAPTSKIFDQSHWVLIHGTVAVWFEDGTYITPSNPRPPWTDSGIQPPDSGTQPPTGPIVCIFP